MRTAVPINGAPIRLISAESLTRPTRKIARPMFMTQKTASRSQRGPTARSAVRVIIKPKSRLVITPMNAAWSLAMIRPVGMADVSGFWMNWLTRYMKMAVATRTNSADAAK